MIIRQARAKDIPAIEAVLDAAFGTDRHQRTAYRVRHGTQPIEELSFVAEIDGQVVASLQCWPVQLHDGAHSTAMVMLGPVAVLPALQMSGIGKSLMETALAMLDSLGVSATMLIGDFEYYGKFGFIAGPTQQWGLPGPFERHRLLVRVADGVVLPATGEVGPRSGDSDDA